MYMRVRAASKQALRHEQQSMSCMRQVLPWIDLVAFVALHLALNMLQGVTG